MKSFYFNSNYIRAIAIAYFLAHGGVTSSFAWERSLKPNALVHLYPDGIPIVSASKQLELESIRELRLRIEKGVKEQNRAAVWASVDTYFSEAPDPDLAGADYLAFIGKKIHREDRKGAVFLGDVARERLERKLLEQTDSGHDVKRSRYLAALGRVYEYLLDQPSDAELLYKQAVELDPNSSATKYYLQKVEKRRQRLSRSEPMASSRVEAVLQGGVK